MKNIIALLALVWLVSGCVVNRPVLTERVVNTNGVVTERSLRINSFAIWPATQSLDKQKVSLGKTFSVGQEGLEQEAGGTNIVEALRAIDSIIGKIRP